MAARKVTTIGVDKKFFDNIFEIQRRKLQEQLGITNLSRTNFTKMIKGFKLIKPKKDLQKVKRSKRGNDFIRI